MLGQQFHNCLLGSSGHWGDHSKHTGNFRVWVPWTYSLRYCVSLTSAHLSETASALGGDDSRTFEHKETLQGIGSAKSSQSGKEDSGGTFRANFKTNIAELAPWVNCLLGHRVNLKASDLLPHVGPESSGLSLLQGITFADPHLGAGPSAHVSGPPISEKSNASRSSEVQPLSPLTFYKWHGCGCWVEAGCVHGGPQLYRVGYTVSTWHVCRVKLAQRGRVGQSEPG